MYVRCTPLDIPRLKINQLERQSLKTKDRNLLNFTVQFTIFQSKVETKYNYWVLLSNWRAEKYVKK